MRRIVVSAAALLLLSCLLLSAGAVGGSYVVDEAGLLTDSQAASLDERAAKISEEYGFGVYIIALSNFREYTESKSVWDCARELYQQLSLGAGQDDAGVLLLLSMAGRDYALVFHGDQGEYAFTEAGRDRMEQRFLRYFGMDSFNSGFVEYLDTCEEYLLAAQNGAPVGQGQPSSADYEGESMVFLAVIPGLIAAVLTGVCLSASMHTARLQRDADSYVSGSLQLHRRSDMFLHRSVSRVRRQTENHSGSSGSTHHSSGGFSGRSGKF